MISPFYVIRTYLPLTCEPNAECLASIDTLRDVCPDFGKIFDLMQASDPIGRVGKYAGVYGVALAAGGDVPMLGSHPVGATPEQPERASIITFTTYASRDVPLSQVHAFVEEIAKLHVWEHPVIEITEAQLWMPNN